LIEGTKGEPVGIFDDQVFAYLIQTKTFLAWAEKRGYPINSSYKSWQIIKRKHTPIALTLSELEALENHIYSSRAEDTARDYLVLQCRTGQRISDIKRFNLKDFSNDKWTFAPKKGNRLSPKEVTVHFKGFCAPALDILHKYNWKLPVISDQKLNDNIKKACKSAGINEHVDFIRWAQNKQIRYSGPKWEFCSNHCGRRTFVTLSLQAGMPAEYVMQLTGITEYKTIRHYKGKFEDNSIVQELEKMTGGKTLMKKAL
jgi:integrase